MNKLNFGCGNRIAEGWINIDFHSSDSRVKRVNLLEGFPYPENHFDAVYSSHVLEHFTPEQALFLLKEANRVLKPNGILRIVVPDLAETCKEYLRVLSLPDNDTQKSQLYEWITIELLDQMVRSYPGGEMGKFIQKYSDSKNPELLEYVESRVGKFTATPEQVDTGFMTKLGKLTSQRVLTKLNYWYIRTIGKLIPQNLRSMIFIETSIGERHRWMYDFYGLSCLCRKAGFENFKSLAYNQSAIAGFQLDFLDSNSDGSIYKANSVFLEAIKSN